MFTSYVKLPEVIDGNLVVIYVITIQWYIDYSITLDY